MLSPISSNLLSNGKSFFLALEAWIPLFYIWRWLLWLVNYKIENIRGNHTFQFSLLKNKKNQLLSFYFKSVFIFVPKLVNCSQYIWILIFEFKLREIRFLPCQYYFERNIYSFPSSGHCKKVTYVTVVEFHLYFTYVIKPQFRMLHTLTLI